MKSKGRFSSFILLLPAFVLSSLERGLVKLSLLKAPGKKNHGLGIGISWKPIPYDFE